MKNAIIVLTRGYDNLEKYNRLLKRNASIEKFFGNKYPLVIFHEGNITSIAMEYIKAKNPSLNFTFVNVSEIWNYADGYKSMCRFNALWVWHFCKQYDYVMRIDEDCIIEKMDTDPFEQMGDNVYLKTCYFEESHTETNETLPRAIEFFTGVKATDFYNHKFPYTNVSVSSVKFWFTEPIYDILKWVSLSDEQFINRWGDLPILGSLLNIYAKGKVGTTTGLSYFHESHNISIESH